MLVVDLCLWMYLVDIISDYFKRRDEMSFFNERILDKIRLYMTALPFHAHVLIRSSQNQLSRAQRDWSSTHWDYMVLH